MNKTKKKRTIMVRAMMLGLLVLLPLAGNAQLLLSLDSCRAMALRNNRQMGVARAKQEVTANLRRSARTKYLPHVSAMGGYVWTSREVSILNDDQKSALGNLGTNASTSLSNTLSPIVSQLPVETQMKIGQDLTQFAGMLDQTGMGIVNALRTDTRNMFAGAVMVTQPVFMGGAIVALNKMADISEDMAENSLESQRQNTIYNIDHAYWQVVSLRHKQKLAESFLELVKKLESDVNKMIDEGVATKSDGLSVSVKVNEAEMALTQVSDGLVLSKMLLCQLCGIPVDTQVVLAEEESEDLEPSTSALPPSTSDIAMANRPELKLLQNTVDLSNQATNLLKAGNLPQVLLMGGYAVTNPNTFNGFEKKFGGFWNLGVVMRIPIWNWGDVKYKVRASKAATCIANLELTEAREMIELQVNQNTFRVSEANKKLAMANANIKHANENLRTANLGFTEGVIPVTTVMEAQTAWLQAQSQKIDAEIDVMLSHVELQKALGTLR